MNLLTPPRWYTEWETKNWVKITFGLASTSFLLGVPYIMYSAYAAGTPEARTRAEQAQRLQMRKDYTQALERDRVFKLAEMKSLVEKITYIRDPRTGVCFALRDGANAVSLTGVACTPEVLLLVPH